MSMIIEQIKQLREEADYVECIHHNYTAKLLREAADTIEQLAAKVRAENGSGWIPIEERLPECEKEVLVCAVYKHGDIQKTTVTTAIYEDGTKSEVDSCWYWHDLCYVKYDEENDCYFIPEGWWEYRHYNPDEVYNNVIDDHVVAWMPLPEPYKEGKE